MRIHSSMNKDDLLFAGDESTRDITPDHEKISASPWEVMVVDDDILMHDVTQLVLTELTFANRRIEILQAYSAKQAIELMEKNSHVALILLDMVMETDQAGLDVVRHIREKMHNHRVRIILRTGQFRGADEQDMMHNYDISYYAEKTALTAGKLHTAIMASLHSYTIRCNATRSR